MTKDCTYTQLSYIDPLSRRKVLGKIAPVWVLFRLLWRGFPTADQGRAGREKETFSGYGGMLNEFDLAAAEIRAGKKESAYVPHSATLAVMKLMDECRRQMGLVYPFEK